MKPLVFITGATISKVSSCRVIPWQMPIVAKLLRLMPNWIFDKALAGRPRKHGKVPETGNTA